MMIFMWDLGLYNLAVNSLFCDEIYQSVLKLLCLPWMLLHCVVILFIFEFMLVEIRFFLEKNKRSG